VLRLFRLRTTENTGLKEDRLPAEGVGACGRGDGRSGAGTKREKEMVNLKEREEEKRLDEPAMSE
jgi:hypothetical protein